MTREERNNKLKCLITCMKCKVSGRCCDENCPTQYDAGNMGEDIENLEEISKILEQEPCEDVISRQAAQAKIKNICDEYRLSYEDGERKAATGGSAYALGHAFDDLPPVTPTESWIPMIWREPTQEEKDDYFAQHGEELCYMLENEMPLNGQEVLVSCAGYVSEDVFDEDFYNFEGYDIEHVDAWMPKPKAYQAEK